RSSDLDSLYIDKRGANFYELAPPFFPTSAFGRNFHPDCMIFSNFRQIHFFGAQSLTTPVNSVKNLAKLAKF
ncbi:MAG: hypothetical protein KDE31_36150, partial [Caldilineaceae bacterium]|nr:hypothetical protein [Caldilineaceae bacterium]